MVLAMAILTFGVAATIVRPIISDHLLWKALRASNPVRRFYLERAVDWNPDSWTNWFYYGEALRAEGKTSAAVMAWEHAAQLEERLVTHELLYRAYLELGRGSDLVRQAEAIVRLNPCYPPNQLRLGDEYKRMGRSNEALKAYREALRLDPSLEGIVVTKTRSLIQDTGQGDDS